MLKPVLAAVLITVLGQGAALAAGPVDPDWPCIQRRQPALSTAQVWAGPAPDDAATARASDPGILALSERLALRRTDLAEAETLIRDFAAQADQADLVALFTLTFERIQGQRNRVMSGITRYAHKQEALDREIDGLRHEFSRESAAEAPDFDRLDKLEADLDWMTRIFQDRQQSLTYVCETPVILEQRAFAIGRLIAGQL